MPHDSCDMNFSEQQDVKFPHSHSMVHTCTLLTRSIQNADPSCHLTLQPCLGAQSAPSQCATRRQRRYHSMLFHRAASVCVQLQPGVDIDVELRMQSCSGWNHTGVAQKCIVSAIRDAVRDRGCASSALNVARDAHHPSSWELDFEAAVHFKRGFGHFRIDSHGS